MHDSVSSSTKRITRENLLIGSALPNNTVTTASIANSAVTPAKRSGGFKVGTFTVTATGSKVVTDVGFTPKLLKVTFTSDSGSTAISAWGMSDGTTSQSGGIAADSSNKRTWTTSSGNFIYVASVTGANTRVASLTSFDSNGFTMNFTTLTATGTWIYEAYA